MKSSKESLTEMQKKEVLRMNNKESNQLTRECLQLSLMHLMSEHPYEKITISEIVRRAGVSRTAFYRNYTDKEDILHELGDEIIKRIAEISEKPELHENPHLWFEDIFRDIKNDKDIISLFDQAGILQNELFLKKAVSERLYPTTDPEKKYLIIAAEAAILQILISWFRDGMQEDEKQMADFCVNIFDNALSRLP